MLELPPILLCRTLSRLVLARICIGGRLPATRRVSLVDLASLLDTARLGALNAPEDDGTASSRRRVAPSASLSSPTPSNRLLDTSTSARSHHSNSADGRTAPPLLTSTSRIPINSLLSLPPHRRRSLLPPPHDSPAMVPPRPLRLDNSAHPSAAPVPNGDEVPLLHTATVNCTATGSHRQISYTNRGAAGKGSFGVVRKVQLEGTDTVLAVKRTKQDHRFKVSLSRSVLGS